MATIPTKYRAARLRSLAVGALALVLCAATQLIHADTVASLLGNFTINQFCGVSLQDRAAAVHYVVVLGQLPALRELHAADTNGDGVTTQVERDAYVQRLAPQFAKDLHLIIDGVPVPLQLSRWTSSLPTEQGGFSLRLDVFYTAPLPQDGGNAVHAASFTNSNYPGRIGWREISVEPAVPIKVFNTDAYGSSLTLGLTQALKSLPASGPLNETAVHWSFGQGQPPAGSTGLLSRASSPATPQAAAEVNPTGETAWLEAQTRRLVNLISAPSVKPQIAILALLAALVLGAFHALSPGHGKTIVGAYLVGSKGTPRHAVFLGITVTITHTLGVFALGFATLFASRFLVPEKLFPILSLVSGLLVFGMGMILMAQRWRSARSALRLQRFAAAPHVHAVFAPGTHGHHVHADGAHSHDHGHDHSDDQSHAAGGLMHSHGGSVHSHMPPGADGGKVSWRSLLALGISGGLIPCPSAMVLLLAAVALNKTAYGLLLVVAFSIGLALTLTLIGLMFLYARSRIRVSNASARWVQLLPVLSAGVITIVGGGLCMGAIQSAQFH
jgi:nickel/cobalt exporter